MLAGLAPQPPWGGGFETVVTDLLNHRLYPIDSALGGECGMAA
jgi:hypothetical protein